MTYRLPDQPPCPLLVAGDGVRATLRELLGVSDPPDILEHTLDGAAQWLQDHL